MQSASAFLATVELVLHTVWQSLSGRMAGNQGVNTQGLLPIPYQEDEHSLLKLLSWVSRKHQLPVFIWVTEEEP